MEQLTALVHNTLIHGDIVEPLQQSEMACIEEIKDVLKKHGKLDRFGITLLHKHFDIAEDEILVEETDEQNRTQIIKPMKRQNLVEMGGEVLETHWALNDPHALMACRRACVKQDNGHYSGVHVFS